MNFISQAFETRRIISKLRVSERIGGGRRNPENSGGIRFSIEKNIESAIQNFLVIYERYYTYFLFIINNEKVTQRIKNHTLEEIFTHR